MKIGIDPSIKSTCICINKDNKRFEFHLVLTSPTQKLLKKLGSFNNIKVHLVEIEDHEDKELKKTRQVFFILNEIKNILKKYPKNSEVILESIALQAKGTIDTLAGLNFGIRNICLEKDFNLRVIQPTKIKKQGLGTGFASKEEVIESLLVWFPEFELLKSEKIDDIADSWMMTML